MLFFKMYFFKGFYQVLLQIQENIWLVVEAPEETTRFFISYKM